MLSRAEIRALLGNYLLLVEAATSTRARVGVSLVWPEPGKESALPLRILKSFFVVVVATCTAPRRSSTQPALRDREQPESCHAYRRHLARSWARLTQFHSDKRWRRTGTSSNEERVFLSKTEETPVLFRKASQPHYYDTS